MASDEAIQNLKEQVDRLEKQLDEANGKVATLAVENKTLHAEKVFTGAGYSPKQAALFVRELPEGAEITADAVKEFATKYDLAPAGTPGEPPKENTSTDSALAAMGGAGTRAGAGGNPGATGSMTRDEYKKLHQSNPAAAAEALARGRVQLREDNFWVQKGAVPSS